MAYEWDVPDAVKPGRDVDVIAELADGLTRRFLEREAASVVRLSLRPRLRWAARRPRALRLLMRVGLWSPPTLAQRPLRLERWERDAFMVYFERRWE